MSLLKDKWQIILKNSNKWLLSRRKRLKKPRKKSQLKMPKKKNNLLWREKKGKLHPQVNQLGQSNQLSQSKKELQSISKRLTSSSNKT